MNLYFNISFKAKGATKMKKNRVVLVLVALLLICSAALCRGAQEEPAAGASSDAGEEAFKVAFVYIGIPGDLDGPSNMIAADWEL